MLVCVVNPAQAATLAALIRKMPDTFAIISHVNEVVGNFKNLDNKGIPQRQLFDIGESKKIY